MVITFSSANWEENNTPTKEQVNFIHTSGWWCLPVACMDIHYMSMHCCGSTNDMWPLLPFPFPSVTFTFSNQVMLMLNAGLHVRIPFLLCGWLCVYMLPACRLRHTHGPEVTLMHSGTSMTWRTKGCFIEVDIEAGLNSSVSKIVIPYPHFRYFLFNSFKNRAIMIRPFKSCIKSPQRLIKSKPSWSLRWLTPSLLSSMFIVIASVLASICVRSTKLWRVSLQKDL